MAPRDKNDRIVILLNEAAALRSKAQYEQAALRYEAALRHQPKNPTVNFLYAEFLLENKELEQARKYFFKAIINSQLNGPYVYSFFIHYSKYWSLDALAPMIGALCQSPNHALSVVEKLLPEKLDQLCQKIQFEVSKNFPNRDEIILIELEILKYEEDNKQYLELSKVASAKDPNDPKFLNHYITALLKNNEEKFALNLIDGFSKTNKPNYALDFNHAVILKKIGRINDAISKYNECISKYGPSKAILYNLANCLESIGQFQKAVEIYKKAILIDENDPILWLNLATTYYNLGVIQEAKNCYQKVLSINPTSAEAESGAALIDLASGRFEQGWQGYEARWRDPVFLNSEKKQSQPYREFFNIPIASDEINDKAILIIAEQGVGDVVMSLSTIPDLMKLTSSITIVFDRRLEKIFKNSYPKISVYSYENFSPAQCAEFDFVVPSGSLGRLFRRYSTDFTGSSFLSISPNEKEKIENKLNILEIKRPRIGISWRGGTSMTRNQHRSIKLDELEQIILSKDVDFVSIQHGDVGEELDLFYQRTGKKIHSFPKSDLSDFSDLGGFIEQMDLIITVQNTNVHIAGALGKQCWALIPTSPEWRYGYSGKVMPWYASVELFRQSEPMNWTPLIDQVNRRLELFVKSLKV